MGHGVLRNGDDNVFFQRGDVNKNRVLIFIRVPLWYYIHSMYYIFFLFFSSRVSISISIILNYVLVSYILLYKHNRMSQRASVQVCNILLTIFYYFSHGWRMRLRSIVNGRVAYAVP